MGKTSCFRAKCVNITRQMALAAAALLQTSRYHTSIITNNGENAGPVDTISGTK